MNNPQSLIEKLEPLKHVYKDENCFDVIERAQEIVRQHLAAPDVVERVAVAMLNEFLKETTKWTLDQGRQHEDWDLLIEVAKAAFTAMGGQHGHGPEARDTQPPPATIDGMIAAHDRFYGGDAKPQASEISGVDEAKIAELMLESYEAKENLYNNPDEDIRKMIDAIRPYLRTTEPVCPYIVTADGGTSHCRLAESPMPVMSDPREDCPWKCKSGDAKCLCAKHEHPVTVSLEMCAKALEDMANRECAYNQREETRMAKAVLDAAGVNYVKD